MFAIVTTAPEPTVPTPARDAVFPTTYALPPSIILIAVTVPPAPIITLAVALTPFAASVRRAL